MMLLVFNCTAGAASIEALRSAGAENLEGKVLVDVANPLELLAGAAAHPGDLQRRQPRRAGPA